MTARAQMRGHKVWHDGQVWRHADDDTLAPASGGAERPCTGCGLTAEAGYGPDPCLGWGDGPACCGHGQVERQHHRHPHPYRPLLVSVLAAAALLAGLLWIGVL